MEKERPVERRNPGWLALFVIMAVLAMLQRYFGWFHGPVAVSTLVLLKRPRPFQKQTCGA